MGEYAREYLSDLATGPTLGPIRKGPGIAGQIGYTVEVTYPGEPASRVTFVGSAYGGPVVMQTPGNPEGMFVTEPGRFGDFGPEWVRKFFA